MTNKVDLEKFTGQNDFNMWRIKMEALLITQGLGDAIDPIIKSENAEASSSRTPEQMAEIDKKARSTIILSLGDSVIREVAKEKTVAGLWAKLEQLYMTKSLANRLYIKKKMFSLRMIEGASLDEHIDEFNKVCDELETIDEGLSDESKALLLISSLPKSYEHFVDALLYGRQSLSLEEVKSALVGIGTVSLKMYDGMVRELTQVRHVPELKRNLISIGMLDQTGCVIKAENGTLKVVRGSIVIMKGTKQNGLYVLNGHTTVGEASVTEKCEDKARLWHLRLGHMSERGLKEFQKNGVFGSDKLSSLGFCEDCILGKASRLKFESAVHSTKEKLAYIHSDLWGPAQVDSLGGCRYFLSFIDDYSKMVWVYVLKTKDEVLERFKRCKILVETQTNLKVKALRTDNGLEFRNKEFGDFCERHGIMRHKIVIHTPKQNGLAERMNRTLMDKVRSPSTTIECKTPIELWFGRVADYSKLRIFGCVAYAHVKQGKLEPRALRCRFLGYPNGVKGYRLWCIDLKPPKCIISRDVTFNESEILNKSKATESKDYRSETRPGSVQFEVESHEQDRTESETEEDTGRVADGSDSV
ncbi:Integrase catalytic domain-containing protein [Citrus sinensis]|nr:Integrase catalytic domain-containing protein [Citrus sinensis]